MEMTVISYDPLPPGLFVWMDLEYTTTNVDTARILEVAAIITDRQLEQIGEPFSLTCKPDDWALYARISCRYAHTKRPTERCLRVNI